MYVPEFRAKKKINANWEIKRAGDGDGARTQKCNIVMAHGRMIELYNAHLKFPWRKKRKKIQNTRILLCFVKKSLYPRYFLLNLDIIAQILKCKSNLNLCVFLFLYKSWKFFLTFLLFCVTRRSTNEWISVHLPYMVAFTQTHEVFFKTPVPVRFEFMWRRRWWWCVEHFHILIF